MSKELKEKCKTCVYYNDKQQYPDVEGQTTHMNCISLKCQYRKITKDMQISNLTNKIADLEAKLAESEEQLKEELVEKKGLEIALSACNRQNDEFADMIKKLVNEKEELKQQLEEKDKDIKYFKESYYMIQDEKDHYAGRCLNLQDRIEELEKNNKRIRKNKDQDKISFAVYELSLVNGMLTDAIIELTQNETDANKLYYLEKIAKKFAEKTGGRINELKAMK